MRAVVFAYHSMGATGLRALLRHGFEVLKVYTHEDDPGENVWFESVAGLCRDRGIAFAAPADVNAPEVAAEIRALKPEIMFSFYYRKMLTKELLDIPRAGALNLHGSLLPAYRGRCPVNWVLIQGEKKTGVTLHYMVEKPDAGDIVAQAETRIAKDDTARSLYEKLTRLAGTMLDQALPLLREGKAPRRPPDLSKGSYFGGRRPEDGRINWMRSAWEVYNLVRALTRPYPGAFAYFRGEKIMIWRAVPDDSARGILYPGELEVEDDKVFVGTRVGTLKLEEIEWKGRVLKAAQIARELGPHQRDKLE